MYCKNCVSYLIKLNVVSHPANALPSAELTETTTANVSQSIVPTDTFTKTASSQAHYHTGIIQVPEEVVSLRKLDDSSIFLS